MIYYKIRHERRMMDESEYGLGLDLNAKPSLVFYTLELKKEL